MRTKSDPRHGARKLALSSLFCWLFTDTGNEECYIASQELLESEEIDNALADDIVKGVKDYLDEIDKIIQKSAPEWPLEKISKIDLVILRIAIYEILFGRKTPLKVAIDEAVELAKEFGNDTSHRFVNGVLGTVVESYQDRIKQ